MRATRPATTFLSMALAAVALGPPLPRTGSPSPAATLTLSPGEGPPTSSVRATGGGFEAFELVDLSFDSGALGTVTADDTGVFTPRIRIPGDAVPGDHSVTAVGESSGESAQATFAVHTAWTQLGFDSSRTNHNPFENVLAPGNVAGLHLTWSTYNAVPGFEPLVAEGVVVESNGGLQAFDQATGAPLWSYGFPPTLYVSGQPAIHDGVVYVQTASYEGEQGPKFYGFDLHTGEVLHGGHGTMASPAFDGQRMYTEVNGVLMAIDPSTLHAVWRQADHPYTTWVTVADGVLFVGDADGGVNAVDATTGTGLWRTPVLQIPLGGPAVEDGVLCIGATTPNGSQYEYYGLDADTGAVLWTLPNLPSIGACSMAEGIAYVSTFATSPPFDTALHALDAATGVEIWSASGVGRAPPIIANGVAYVVVSDHPAAFDAATGAQLWTVPEFALNLSVVDGTLFADGTDVIEYGL